MGGVFASAPTASKNIGTLSQMSIARKTSEGCAMSRMPFCFLAVLILARGGDFRAARVEFHMVGFIRALRFYGEDSSKVRYIGGVL